MTPETIERLAEHLYGHPRSAAIEWGKEDKFESCYRQAEEIMALVAPLVRAEALEEVRQLVANDAYAITFQTFGQYRTGLLASIRALASK